MGYSSIHITAGIQSGKTLAACATAGALLQVTPKYKSVLLVTDSQSDLFKSTILGVRKDVNLTVSYGLDNLDLKSGRQYDIVIADYATNSYQLSYPPLVADGGKLIITHNLDMMRMWAENSYGAVGKPAQYRVTEIRQCPQNKSVYNSTRSVAVIVEHDDSRYRLRLSNFELSIHGIEKALNKSLLDKVAEGSVVVTGDQIAQIVDLGMLRASPCTEVLQAVERFIDYGEPLSVIKMRAYGELHEQYSLNQIAEEIDVAITRLRK